MKLLVDIGNSRIKWGWYRDGEIHSPDACSYTMANLSGDLDSIWLDCPVPSGVHVSSVRGNEVNSILAGWLLKHWKVTPDYATVTAGEKGVTNGYEQYTQLGIDRWLVLLATWNRWKKPACIVDCGTAITIDNLDDRGNHLGGFILPGLSMMRQALHDRLPVIPGNSGIITGNGYARTTEQGASSGCLLAAVSLIERITNDMQSTFDNRAECVITGGDAGVIMKNLSIPFHHRPLLVLEGLVTRLD